ncbi:MAG: response regulator transcription factor [Anaerolineae bacterium]|nr:response regulator transcription factor [Anaerolineae bacterium]
MERIRVLVVDDHTVVRTGIQMLVSTEPAIQIVGEAKNGREAIYLAQVLQPDIIVMDLVMPEKNGIEAIAQIKRDYPGIKILVLTTFEDEIQINAALEAGADGYQLKDANGEALLHAIRATQMGDMPLHPRVARYLFKFKAPRESISLSRVNGLTEREREVLQLIARGLGNKEIAQILNLTTGTVKIHVSNILSKLKVSTRTEASVLAAQAGLVTLETQKPHGSKPDGLRYVA